ncbi:hypothetical protein Moror_7842 [Moniliophthora roreri MCA 2997]|uniref:Uncharacterized protein n=1 Tax=Moniliophthora roreri (strain MCA 2997) TaxID=1381753 RepID=V2WTC1_MONRO|nr:hypothetical protein Moror_7842 [Moniliophthora roreri MCA 2997]
MHIPSPEDSAHQVSDLMRATLTTSWSTFFFSALRLSSLACFGLSSDRNAVENGILVGQMMQIIEIKQIEYILEYRVSQIRTSSARGTMTQILSSRRFNRVRYPTPLSMTIRRPRKSHFKPNDLRICSCFPLLVVCTQKITFYAMLYSMYCGMLDEYMLQ